MLNFLFRQTARPVATKDGLTTTNRRQSILELKPEQPRQSIKGPSVRPGFNLEKSRQTGNKSRREGMMHKTRKSAKRESAIRGSVKRESARRGSVKRESARRGSVKRESARRDSAIRGSVRKKNSNTVPLLQPTITTQTQREQYDSNMQNTNVMLQTLGLPTRQQQKLMENNKIRQGNFPQRKPMNKFYRPQNKGKKPLIRIPEFLRGQGSSI